MFSRTTLLSLVALAVCVAASPDGISVPIGESRGFITADGLFDIERASAEVAFVNARNQRLVAKQVISSFLGRPSKFLCSDLGTQGWCPKAGVACRRPIDQ